MTSRKRTIGIAYLATGGAKITGALVQLAVLPIAAHALGADALGLLFTVAAMASFPLIAMAGFSPAASVLMAKAGASRDSELAGRYFWSLLSWGLAGGVLFTTASYLVLKALSLPGASDPLLLPLMLLFLALNFVTSPVDGARAAMRQSHYGSGFAVAGSVITLAMAVFVPPQLTTAPYFFAAIYLAPVAVQLFNLLAFVGQHRAMLGRPRIDRAVGGEIRQLLLANMQAQGGMVLYLHGSVFLLSQALGTASVAVIGAFVRAAALVHSMLTALFAPVLPTLTEAVLKGDNDWVRRGLRHLLAIASTFLLLQGIITILGGRWIARDILDVAGDADAGFYLALAAFIFCYSATHLLFLARLSTAAPQRKGIRIFVAALAGLGIGQLFFSDNVPQYLAVQAICMAVIAMGVYARDLFGVIPATYRNKGE